jgi:hypothetical protein
MEKLFQNQLLPNTGPGRVIITDNAAYHRRRSGLLPTIAQRKKDMRLWLLANNATCPEESLKRELLHTVESVTSENISCVVDEKAGQTGVNICRVLSYHCKLNPAVLVWSQYTVPGVFCEQFDRQCIRCSSDNQWTNRCKARGTNWTGNVEGGHFTGWCWTIGNANCRPFQEHLHCRQRFEWQQQWPTRQCRHDKGTASTLGR